MFAIIGFRNLLFVGQESLFSRGRQKLTHRNSGEKEDEEYYFTSC